ncbi:MAG: flavodoxin [Eubacteriales bacterium]|nr:flavodoxin [Eubacteriales bacterium]
MKIGIIVHSFTGNTLSVANKLMDALMKKGHTVAFERVVVKNENTNQAGNIELEQAPNPSEYDIIYFAAPVRAFSLSPGMKTYLSQVESLQGKKAGCFVTQQLKYRWLGGNHALRQMAGLIRQKGGEPIAFDSVSWSGKDREAQIERVVANLCGVVPNAE